jgi:hypothetical protein
MEWILGISASVIVAFVTAKLTARREKEILKEELKLDYSIETAIVHLLENPDYRKRGLKKIKHHLRGFRDDDELRMAMIRAGAVAFGGEGDSELWGLLSRNLEDIR